MPPSSSLHAHPPAEDPSSLDMCNLEPLPLLLALGISYPARKSQFTQHPQNGLSCRSSE